MTSGSMLFFVQTKSKNENLK